MPKTIKEERLRCVLPILNKEIRLKDAAKVCPHSQRSLERWLSNYRRSGEAEGKAEEGGKIELTPILIG